MATDLLAWLMDAPGWQKFAFWVAVIWLAVEVDRRLDIGFGGHRG